VIEQMIDSGFRDKPSSPKKRQGNDAEKEFSNWRAYGKFKHWKAFDSGPQAIGGG
jgi:hypothetical protein